MKNFTKISHLYATLFRSKENVAKTSSMNNNEKDTTYLVRHLSKFCSGDASYAKNEVEEKSNHHDTKKASGV